MRRRPPGFHNQRDTKCPTGRVLQVPAVGITPPFAPDCLGAREHRFVGPLIGLAIGSALRGGAFGVGSHMTLAIEIGAGFYLQFARMEIAVYLAAAFELQQFFHFNGTGNLAHDIGLLSANVAIDHTIGTNHYFSRAMDITLECAVDADIAAAADIAFEGCAGGNNAGATGRWSFLESVGLGLLVKHMIGFKIKLLNYG
jgi:hypothetical protein